MLLLGFSEKHKEDCTEDDCPLRQAEAHKDSDEDGTGNY